MAKFKLLIILIVIINFSNFGQLQKSLIEKFGSQWFDATYLALKEYVSKKGLNYSTVSDLPSYALDELKSCFSTEILENVKIYYPIPLNSIQTKIGLINQITSFLGGENPAAQTFETNIYLEEFDAKKLDDRKTLAHEIVHVKQYLEFGYDGFKLRYKNALLEGKTYMQIPLEVEAYSVSTNFPFIKSKIELDSKNNILPGEYLQVQTFRNNSWVDFPSTGIVNGVGYDIRPIWKFFEDGSISLTTILPDGKKVTTNVNKQMMNWEFQNGYLIINIMGKPEAKLKKN